MKDIYIRTRDTVKKKCGEVLLMKDVMEISCADSSVERGVGAIRVKEAVYGEDMCPVGVMELISLIRSEYPDAGIIPLDAGDVLVRYEERKKRRMPEHLINALLLLFLFLSSAFSVMYFHMDVEMLMTHREFVRILTGIETRDTTFFSIVYSLGIGLGMYLFFRNRKVKKTKIPSPIDLKMDEYRKAIADFIKNKKAGGKG